MPQHPIEPDPVQPKEENSPQPSPVHALWSLLREMFETLAPAFVVAVLINIYLAQSTFVYGQSMEPNLHTDQRLIVEKVSYRFHGPRRGDIVVVNVPGFDIPLIKRVIGLPGETVEIRDNRVWIDGVSLQEPYLPDMSQHNCGPFKIPVGHVFVMGDNRNASNDSRYFGAVQMDRIVGRAWISYWPADEIHLFP